MQFDQNILEEIILYACTSCEASDVGAVKLHKVAYFADMIHFAQHGRAMAGATYKKRPFGPTCEQLQSTLRNMTESGSLEIETVDYFGFWKKNFTPKRQANLNLFTAEQLALLDEVVDFVCVKNTAKSISDFSHNRAWEIASFGEEIPYHSVFLIYPTEVSKEAFDWAQSEGETIAAAEQEQSSVEFVDFRTLRSRVSA